MANKITQKKTISSLLRVKRHFQLTLPAHLRKILNIEEGDFVEAEIKDNKLVLKPRKLIDADQSWFWSREWQKGEKQAEKDIQKGKISSAFKTAKDLRQALHK
ncbi:AbrB/MazE/SpoVT family DNA-binding domain-containing protein [Patescibacteria group bacterium AH-259-L07]|nr:AbrB/MazE/SpoVT family DNA-binding domain-containing protein [Patescibacteria group bacterium AH-259-L07]